MPSVLERLAEIRGRNAATDPAQTASIEAPPGAVDGKNIGGMAPADMGMSDPTQGVGWEGPAQKALSPAVEGKHAALGGEGGVPAEPMAETPAMVANGLWSDNHPQQWQGPGGWNYDYQPGNPEKGIQSHMVVHGGPRGIPPVTIGPDSEFWEAIQSERRSLYSEQSQQPYAAYGETTEPAAAAAPEAAPAAPQVQPKPGEPGGGEPMSEADDSGASRGVMSWEGEPVLGTGDRLDRPMLTRAEWVAWQDAQDAQAAQAEEGAEAEFRSPIDPSKPRGGAGPLAPAPEEPPAPTAEEPRSFLDNAAEQFRSMPSRLGDEFQRTDVPEATAAAGSRASEVASQLYNSPASAALQKSAAPGARGLRAAGETSERLSDQAMSSARDSSARMGAEAREAVGNALTAEKGQERTAAEEGTAQRHQAANAAIEGDDGTIASRYRQVLGAAQEGNVAEAVRLGDGLMAADPDLKPLVEGLIRTARLKAGKE